MDLYNTLKPKKMKVREIPNWGTYLRKEWEGNFVSHLSKAEKDSIYLYDVKDGACGFLWHVFSYEKLRCLEKKQAEEAFNLVEKKSCYIFFQHSDHAYILENAQDLKASDLQFEEDIDEKDLYVVDTEFNWTYVITHEKEMLGPYFVKKER
ncbi:DUF4275 family protein [Robertmurraya sp. GLU-23]